MLPLVLVHFDPKKVQEAPMFLLLVQSNLSNTDTEGTERSVRIREVSV